MDCANPSSCLEKAEAGHMLYKGRPVVLSNQTVVYQHSRSLQSSFTNTFVRTCVPGLHGTAPADANFAAQLDEHTERLRRQHQTLAAVRQHSAQALQEAPEQTEDTLSLRRNVNQSLTSQLEYFVSCMSQYVKPTQQQRGL